MTLERNNSACCTESTHSSTYESMSHLSTSNNHGEETSASGSGFSAMSKIEEDTDNFQAPKPSPRPTSRSAQLRPAHNACSLKARTINPVLSGQPPTAAMILPINALQGRIPLNRQQDLR